MRAPAWHLLRRLIRTGIPFPLAGPVEFSTTDIVFALLILIAAAFALPAIVGGVALLLYRRRTPLEEQTPRTARLTFFRAFALGLVAQLVLGSAIGAIAEVFGSDL